MPQNMQFSERIKKLGFSPIQSNNVNFYTSAINKTTILIYICSKVKRSYNT
jgi:hypothetical protein